MNRLTVSIEYTCTEHRFKLRDEGGSCTRFRKSARVNSSDGPRLTFLPTLEVGSEYRLQIHS